MDTFANDPNEHGIKGMIFLLIRGLSVFGLFFFFLRLKTHRNIKPSVYMWGKIPDDQWPQCFPIALDFADIVKQKYEIIDFPDCWDDRRKIGITCIILTLPNFWNIGDHSRYYKTSISQSETSPILLARYLSLVA